MSQVSNHTSTVNHGMPPVIFIVDDEPMVGELVETIFSLEGWNTRVFQSPGEALVEIGRTSRPPDLFLTDFRMPGMNGMELIQGVKRQFPDLRTILFSGNVDESIQSEYPLRADAFIRKPFYPHALIETARKVMNGTLSGSRSS
jgi:two-component system nitrogen regulation response regulator GlnG